MRALVALLCLGGMRNAMTRYVAAYRAETNPGAVRGTVRIGLGSAFTLSALATVVLLLLTPFLANDAFGEPALQRGLLYAAWSLVPATVTIVALAATQGFQTMRAYALIGSVMDAGVRMIFVVVGVLLGGLEFGLLGLLVSAVLTMIASLIALYRLMRTLAPAPARYHYVEIVRYSMYSWLASVANQGLLWADTIILGLYLPSRDVGVYQVATRAVLLATIAVVPLTASYAPLAADLWHRRAIGPLQRIYQATSEWLVRISFLPLVMVAVFAGTMLRVFGSGFSDGVIVIQIFAFGSIIDVWASTAGVTLNMSGFNKLNMLDTVAVLVLNVGLNVLLIPHFGIVGSVWAWTIALGVYGTVRVEQVKRLVLKVWPVSYRIARDVRRRRPRHGRRDRGPRAARRHVRRAARRRQPEPAHLRPAHRAVRAEPRGPPVVHARSGRGVDRERTGTRRGARTDDGLAGCLPGVAPHGHRIPDHDLVPRLPQVPEAGGADPDPHADQPAARRHPRARRLLRLRRGPVPDRARRRGTAHRGRARTRLLRVVPIGRRRPHRHHP